MPAQLRAASRAIAAAPRFDIALAGIVIVIAESEIWLPQGSCLPGGQAPMAFCNFGESLGPRAVEIVFTTLIALPLIGRRRYPLQVLLLISVLSIAKALVWVGSPDLGSYLPLLIASYSVGRYYSGVHGWLLLACAAAVVLLTQMIHDLRVPGQTPNGSLATFYLVLLGALPMGRAMQVNDLRAALSEARVRQVTLSRDEMARRAVADERARIARELHDVAAHGMSLIVVQAVGAQGVLDSSPELALGALEAIEREARRDLDEMRRLLAVIQPEPEGPALEPAPGIDAIEPLVERVAATGQPVKLHMDGDGSALGPGLQLTLYRCVQEALTNVVKHARGGATIVSLAFRSDRVELDIVNQPGELTESAAGSGRGLIGMRERVQLYGGQVEAGPVAGGSFRVKASIPLAEEP